MFLNQIPDNFKLIPESQDETPPIKEHFFPIFHEKMLNLAGRRKKRCAKIEKKIGAAGSFCMDQSYFRFLFRLARKSKQSGLSKSEKSLAKRNATLGLNVYKGCGIPKKSSGSLRDCAKFGSGLRD